MLARDQDTCLDQLVASCPDGALSREGLQIALLFYADQHIPPASQDRSHRLIAECILAKA